MKRRRFITLLGGAAAAWPLVAPAQQSPMPVVGFISSRSRDADAHLIAILHQRLKEAGYVEGHNMAFEYRWAEGQYDRLLALAGWWALKCVDSLILRLALNASLGGSLGFYLFLRYGLPHGLKRELLERAPGRFNPILRRVLVRAAR